MISIHAPARGATVLQRCHHCRWQFQSTLPRGERRNRSIKIQLEPTISIHAPARGATTISAKNSLLFSAKINNFSNYKCYFTFYNLLFFVKCTLFVHFLWCESPGIFMSASYSHPSFLLKKQLLFSILRPQSHACLRRRSLHDLLSLVS